ncbi:MAG: TlpA family protein disulfide reductase [Acidimicrobiia bacterium]|nr:TlpA family protein disulfide reductase [Acidimicrobiia bacterium]
MDRKTLKLIGSVVVLAMAVTACSETPAESLPTITTLTPTTTSGPASETSSTTTAPPIVIGEQIEISGNELPMFEPNNDQAIGLPAPRVEATSFDGTPVTIDHDGETYKMIVFLAHWCSHCQEEVPEVRDWLATYDLGDEIEIVSVSTGERSDRPNWPPKEWLTREQWPVPVIEDSLESDISMAYGLQAFPYWVFLDKDGSVLLRANGLSSEALTQIADQIKAFDESLETSS